MLLAPWGIVLMFWVPLAPAPQAPAQKIDSSPFQARAFLDKYCITCHNERTMQSGLMLDRMDVSNAAEAGAWERVVRRLRTASMPPDGRPRPDRDTYATVAASIEGALDRAAAVAPNPGRARPVRRLTRTEYKNAVRDLLGIEHFPKSMDIAVLLPADNSSSGFDNLADLLFVSPTVLDAYLSASRKSVLWQSAIQTRQ